MNLNKNKYIRLTNTGSIQGDSVSIGAVLDTYLIAAHINIYRINISMSDINTQDYLKCLK